MVQTGRNYTQTETIRKAFRSLMQNVNTCLPGEVQMYDPATRRARVVTAVQKSVRGSYINDPPIVDVPVIMPHASGYGIYPPIHAGDLVMVVFSQRGIGTFKRRLASGSPPDRVGFFSFQDAIAIPGWGPATVTPVAPEALVVQKDDGTIYISVGDDGVELGDNAGAIFLKVNKTGVQIEAPNITIMGVLTVNGQTVAAQPPGTESASGPGSHEHGLTVA